MISRVPVAGPIFEGSTVHMLCEAIDGDSPIFYSWIDPDGLTLFPGDTDGMISFDIFSYGIYTCAAAYRFGVVNSTVELVEAGNNRSFSPITCRSCLSTL